ncbi:MAG TPA: alpha/beta hydrolase-fold protein [Mucilaginibacter sp.]
MNKNFFFCAFLVFGQIFLTKAQVKAVFKTGKTASLKTVGERLFLAGDFNGWNPADTAWLLKPGAAGEYAIMKILPKGIYHFKVTHGSWQKVECTAEGRPVDNRMATLVNDTTITLNVAGWQDNFAPEEKKHTASAQVHIINEKFGMPQLGRRRRVWIYLPADYAPSKKKYPVIYMHDGQNLFDACTSGYGEWGIDELLDKVTPQQESIVVGVDHGGEYRITEYDPYDSKYGKGRGDDYTEFLVKTLKPYIDRHYRTQKNAANTTVAGSSMGGLISMYAALKHPEVFGNAGVFSPAFWIAPDIYKYAEQQKLTDKSRFYFVCGDAESDSMVADMKKMAGIIRGKIAAETNSPVVVIKGASHNEKQWNGDFPAFYEWLWKRY